MKNKFGIFFMILGTALILAALALFLYNQKEAADAGRASVNLLPQLLEQIEVQKEEAASEEETLPVILPGTPVEFLDPSALEMTEVEIDGYGYIGYLSIPAVEMELPIMGNWDYARLKVAPCRYTGSTKSDDLVIMAHNYARHFGTLSELKEGNLVTFTDMDGILHQYEVVARDVLAPTAVEEVTGGLYDLTLFTCTYGGASRVTVYCDRVKG